MSIQQEQALYEGAFAVIFCSSLRMLCEDEIKDYQSTAEQMVKLAEKQPGFLGVESTRGEEGLGISVSYWKDLDSIKAWRDNELHAMARKKGKMHWYQSFSLKIAKIERAYSFEL